MALNKNKTQFEDAGDVATSEPSQTSPAAEAAASTAAKNVITVVSNESKLPVKAVKFGNLYEGFREKMPAMDYDAVPRVVGSNGAMKAKLVGKDVALGVKIKFQLLSFNDNFTISPGDDSDEARKMVRYSRNGKTIDSTGEDVTTYLEKLKTVEGFTTAAVKHYVELVGLIVESEKGKELEGQLVVVSLSPKSVSVWNGYQGQASVDVLLTKTRKEDELDLLSITADVRAMGKNDFTLLVVGRP